MTPSQAKKVGGGGVEASGEELGGKGVVLEVYGGVGEAGWGGDVGLEEEGALPGLGGGVVDLIDVEVRVGVAVGEGV